MCIYMCIYIYIYLWTHVCTHGRVHMHRHVHTYVHMDAYMTINTLMPACKHTTVHIHLQILGLTKFIAGVHIYRDIDIHVYVYIGTSHRM